MSYNRHYGDLVNNPLSLPVSWSAALCEPLISTTRRSQLDAQMRQRAAETPLWAATFLGGMISDAIRTLPSEDPWRHMPARMRVGQVSLTRGDIPHPPEATGALLRNEAFGSPDSGKDLVDLTPGDPSSAVASAALVEGLNHVSGAVLAFGADGWKHSTEALVAVPRGGRDLFDTGADALRWALWRRRTYVGLDDPMTMLSAMQWAWRAQQVLESGEVELSDSEMELIAQAISDYGIEDGSYERYRLS